MASTGKMNLNVTTLKQLTKEPPSGNVFDTELAGYHVRPGQRGLTFRLFYRTKTGIQRVLTIGRFGTLTADQARKIATEALLTVAQGGDPRALLEEAKVEKQRQQEQTLRAYLDDPYTAYQNRKKDGKGTLRRIQMDFAGWLDKPMTDITRADVEHWQAEQENAPKPRSFNTLKRSYDALRGLLAHAAERDVIPSNPLLRIKLQQPALSEDDLAELACKRRYLEQ